MFKFVGKVAVLYGSYKLVTRIFEQWLAVAKPELAEKYVESAMTANSYHVTQFLTRMGMIADLDEDEDTLSVRDLTNEG